MLVSLVLWLDCLLQSLVQALARVHTVLWVERRRLDRAHAGVSDCLPDWTCLSVCSIANTQPAGLSAGFFSLVTGSGTDGSTNKGGEKNAQASLAKHSSAIQHVNPGWVTVYMQSSLPTGAATSSNASMRLAAGTWHQCSAQKPCSHANRGIMRTKGPSSISTALDGSVGACSTRVPHRT